MTNLKIRWPVLTVSALMLLAACTSPGVGRANLRVSNGTGNGASLAPGKSLPSGETGNPTGQPVGASPSAPGATGGGTNGGTLCGEDPPESSDTGGSNLGRFAGMKLPAGWATGYVSEAEVLRGMRYQYEENWACFSAFYPEAAAFYKKLYNLP